MRWFHRRVGILFLANCLACAPDHPELPPSADPESTPPRGRPRAAEPTRGSVYALDLDLVDQSGRTVSLDAQRGHPVLLSMFYTSCPMACPLLLQEIRSIEATVPAEHLAGVRVVLVSMDPEHDVPSALSGVVEEHGLDARWTLGAVPPGDVRTVAAALGVRYRPLPEGGFTHTSVITLVDGEGRIVARAEGHEGREALVTALRTMAAVAGL